MFNKLIIMLIFFMSWGVCFGNQDARLANFTSGMIEEVGVKTVNALVGQWIMTGYNLGENRCEDKNMISVATGMYYYTVGRVIKQSDGYGGFTQAEEGYVIYEENRSKNHKKIEKALQDWCESGHPMDVYHAILGYDYNPYYSQNITSIMDKKSPYQQYLLEGAIDVKPVFYSMLEVVYFINMHDL